MLKEGSEIAVIGAGISGVTAAYLLQRKYNVTLFESEKELGGHAYTVNLADPDLGEIGIDMGFIVLNDRNYPNFSKFLSELNVEIQPSEMSFGFYCEKTNFAYSATSLNGLFANRSNLLKPSFYKFLSELRRFGIAGLEALKQNNLSDSTMRQFLGHHNFGGALLEQYLIPMGQAIWSCGQSGVLNYPAEAFLNFFKNHGLLDLTDRPQWQTVKGGSQSYLKQFRKSFKGNIHCNSPVLAVSRGDTLTVKTVDGEKRFAAVVCATHAPTTLKLLESPTELEQQALAPWKYTSNKVSLHTDETFLPPNKRAWASWNYRQKIRQSTLPAVSYWMNNLQSIKSNTTYCVTLNEDTPRIKTIKSVEFEHPLYSSESLATQKLLPSIQGQRGLYFCGAYFGYGFHEDGCQSGRNVASLLGVEW